MIHNLEVPEEIAIALYDLSTNASGYVKFAQFIKSSVQKMALAVCDEKSSNDFDRGYVKGLYEVWKVINECPEAGRQIKYRQDKAKKVFIP